MTPPGSSSPRARARSRSPAPGSPRCAQGAGPQARLLPDARPRGGATRSRSAARACRGRSPRSRSTPTSRRPTSTSSPTPRPPTCRSRPATCRRWRASVRPKAPAAQDIFTAWKDLNDSDGLTPYMDYATPTFFDDFSGAVQKLMAGKHVAGRVHEVDAGGLREVHRHAVTDLAPPASRGASPTCTCCRGWWCSGVRAGAAAAQRVAVAVHMGRRDGGDVERARQLLGDRLRPEDPLGVPARAAPGRSTRRCRSRSGWCWRPRCRVRACAGWRCSGRSCSCRR